MNRIVLCVLTVSLFLSTIPQVATAGTEVQSYGLICQMDQLLGNMIPEVRKSYVKQHWPLLEKDVVQYLRTTETLTENAVVERSEFFYGLSGHSKNHTGVIKISANVLVWLKNQDGPISVQVCECTSLQVDGASSD